MSDRTCKQMEDLLVDYADEQLPADQREPVEAHLAGCEPCRRLLDALRGSEDLAQMVWQEAYNQVADLRPTDVLPRRRQVPVYIGAAAAAIVLALVAILTWRVLLAPAPRQPSPLPVRPQLLIADATPLTPERARRDVDAAGTTVALLASVDWLAEQPSNREIARQQYEFITHMYAGTEIAAQARSRLAALEQRSS